MSDCGAGTRRHPRLRDLLVTRVGEGVPLVWDPHPRGAPRCREPDWYAQRAEAIAALGGRIAGPELPAEALLTALRAAAVRVTAGAGGA